MGPFGVLGVATGYGRDGPGARTSVGDTSSGPVQTVPEANPASCTTGAASLSGEQSGWGAALTIHPL
jgi:hypothetical protein